VLWANFEPLFGEQSAGLFFEVGMDNMVVVRKLTSSRILATAGLKPSLL